MHPFAQGAALGLSAATSPGPFQAFLLAQAVRLGALRALPAALAPLVSDGPIIAAVLLALSRAPEWLLRGLQVAGGLFLLFLAQGTLRAAAPAGPSGPAPRGGGGFLRAVTMNALSPGPWIFWSLVSGPVLVESWRASPARGLSFLGGFYLLLVGGNAALVLAFAGARRFGPGAARGLGLCSGLALAGFGIHQLWRGTLGWAG
jgi:threonine/homoserine/homoserine lactone efflux protein